MSALLDVRSVSYAYPGHPVLDSVEFSAEGGEFVVLMGVNGAGKSTLVDILAGLRALDSGEVLLQGRDLRAWPARERARCISHLPQGNRHELPFTVEQVVLMGRYAFADRWFESPGRAQFPGGMGRFAARVDRRPLDRPCRRRERDSREN